MRADSDIAPAQTASEEHGARVIPLRGRSGLGLSIRPPVSNAGMHHGPGVTDLAVFERTTEPDDYRHRMIVNALVLVFTVALMAAGIWLADSMTALRKKQDCALVGRLDCAHIQVPANVHG